jgi:hypothetical protein
MSFDVDPSALRRYASQLSEVERVAEDCQRYVAAHGNFSFHERGIIGSAAPGHHNLMVDLQQLLEHLAKLGVESQAALRSAADEYMRTDKGSAAKVDATYPEVSRVSNFRG